MLSRTVPPNSVASCGTRPIWPRRLASVTDRTSVPSIRSTPLPTSHRRGTRATSVVLPDPDGPTSASTSPASISREIERRTRRSGRYPKLTLSISIRPATGGSSGAWGASTRAAARANCPAQPGGGGGARADRHAVEQEAGQGADGQRALDDPVPRVPQQDCDRAEPEEAHTATERRAPQREHRPEADDAREVVAVALHLEPLADVALDDPYAAQCLLCDHGAAGDRVLDLGGDPLERPPEHERDDDQHWGQHEGDDEQRGAEDKQDHDRAEQSDQRRQQRGRRLGEHRAHQRHVARQARDQLADPRSGVEV